MILVTGATGTVGGAVARQLAASGVAVRALVRQPEKATELAAQGVELAIGSFDEPTSLQAALTGIQRAFVVVVDGPNHTKQLGNFIEAAKANGLERLVLLSGEGAASDSPRTISRWHWEREELVRQSGLNYVFIKPIYIMQNFLQFGPVIASQSRFFGPLDPDYKLGMIDARDIAASAIAALQRDDLDSQEYIISGPELLTFRQIAEQLSALLGRSVQYVEVPVPAYEQQMKQNGLPDWLAAAVVNMLAQPSAVTTDNVKKLTGHEPISFARFLADNVRFFQAD